MVHYLLHLRPCKTFLAMRRYIFEPQHTYIFVPPGITFSYKCYHSTQRYNDWTNQWAVFPFTDGFAEQADSYYFEIECFLNNVQWDVLVVTKQDIMFKQSLLKIELDLDDEAINTLIGSMGYFISI